MKQLTPAIRLGASVLAMALAFSGSAALAQSSNASGSDDSAKSPIIVTGVFSAKSIESAPISINVVTTKELAQQNPVSAADLLKNIPGVFVNSSLGEIRNVVFSRGISANSLDGAGGYYYVSMQEDGLPVDVVTALNYGPDYYLRSDITLSRLEGLRGGTAVITGPNAPGGIFNYISKNGKSNPGIEAQAKFGLQGNGKLPYYRLDLYAGGQVGSDLYASIGGFLRTDDGTHNAGYELNRGGQVKANLLYDYSSGSVLFTAKYLDDRNDWNEFTPALGGTQIAPGFSNVSSDLQPRAGAHCIPGFTGSGTDCWDPSNLVHSQSLAFGMNWNQDLGGGFKIENKARYSHNKSDWNSGAVLSVVSPEDPIVNIIMGTAFAPGTYNYYQGSTLMASITSNLGNTFIPGNYTVNVNNLPNQGIVAESSLPGDMGFYVGFADRQVSKSDQFQDQLTLTGQVGNHHLALGAYVALAKLTTDNSIGPGIGLMTLQPQPQMLTETYTDPGGTTYQVTDPTGFGAYGQPALDSYHGTQKQYSVFFGDSWEAADKLTIEAGGRWEKINYDIFNQTWLSSPFAAVPMFNPTGGVDGDPLTLYDNAYSSFGPVLETRRSYDYFNYSAAIDYMVSDSVSTYIRWSDGKKAPDFGGIESINTPGQIATQFDAPQKIQQLEVGIKYDAPGINIQLFPFYSVLKNVNVPAIFNYTSGPKIGQQYVEPAFQGTIKTLGIEMSASADLTRTLNVHANLTLQNPKASNFYSWAQGPLGDGSDDVKTLIPEGDADNNPKVIFRGGFNWRPLPPVNLFANVTYLGKRAANAANAFYLPAYTTVDLGATVNITKNISAQFNVNNLFNEVGVMSWSRTGFLASLDRQGLTAAQYSTGALYPIVPNQARSFFWTLTAKY